MNDMTTDETVESPAVDLQGEPTTDKKATVSWIALGPPGGYDVDIDITVRDGRILVTEDDLRDMAAGIIRAGLAPLAEDAAYARDILASPRVDDEALYDVTDTAGHALEDQLKEEGLWKPKRFRVVEWETREHVYFVAASTAGDAKDWVAQNRDNFERHTRTTGIAVIGATPVDGGAG